MQARGSKAMVMKGETMVQPMSSQCLLESVDFKGHFFKRLVAHKPCNGQLHQSE